MIALLRVLAGLAGWAAGFSLLYGVHGLACARGWWAIDIGPVDLQRVLLVAAWLGSVAVIGVWTRLVFRAPAGALPLLDWLTRASAVVGLVAMLVSGLPVAVSRQCGADSLPPAGTPGAAVGFHTMGADRRAVAHRVIRDVGEMTAMPDSSARSDFC
ncbi:hypothetical protein [Polymorphobacter fuscus]|uniref:hypothetical protein n=1 Tax=Sandarakinorhabdus fusca TaxID=1439888 RepID=UPI00168FFD82|nr:hypothetical protein [Polymorphobacter fuscus]NJC09992.1 hypothetical protein [Polymorphobacter fuscus]